MSEPIIVALIGLVGVIAGTIATLGVQRQRDQIDAASEMLHLEAEVNRLWLWNRQLVDHIYKGAPPPPPPPPEGLFDNH